MLTFFCSTLQLVPYITTSNNWCSCGHYNVSLATILHYNLQGHNTAANITMLTCLYLHHNWYPPSQLAMDWYSCRHYNVLLTTILHYNLQGHNTAANITMLTCLYLHHNWYPPSQLAMTGTPVDIIMFCSQLSCIATCMVIILLQKSQLQCHLAVSHM
jgi:hypothetical protein